MADSIIQTQDFRYNYVHKEKEMVRVLHVEASSLERRMRRIWEMVSDLINTFCGKGELRTIDRIKQITKQTKDLTLALDAFFAARPKEQAIPAKPNVQGKDEFDEDDIKDGEEAQKEPSIIDNKWTDAYSFINKLQSQTYIAGNVTSYYCRYLQFKNRDKNVQVVEECAKNIINQDLTLPKVENYKPIMIPVVLKGMEWGQDHIVAIYITFDEFYNANIEFYDPKGLTIKDHANTRLAYKSMTLETLVAKIADRYCANGLPKVIENTNKVQHDCHNCGVYVNNYFEQRLSGKSMKEISSNFNSYASTMDMRHRMIENIVNNWREI